jgi:predicted permease
VNSALKSSSRGTTGGRRGQWTRDALIISEIALACVLMIAAGLLTRSLFKVLNADTGFRPAMVAAVRVDPGKEHLTSMARFVAYVDEVLARTRGIPGVQSAGLADALPLGGNRSWSAGAQGVAYTEATMPSAFVHVVSDGYVSAMGMRLVSGRDFTPNDDASSAKVIVINETMARTLFPGQRALDRIVMADTLRRVIGIVGDVRHLALDASAGNEMYLPFRQTSDFSAVHVVARTTMAPEAFTHALRDALQQIVPNLPAKDFQTLQERVDRALSPRRFTTALLNGFALFAVLLALLGIHGVVTYTVNQRAQEMGVRMALGASAGRLKLGIVRSTLTLAALGMLLGTVASLGLVRWMSGFLFGVRSTDPATFAMMLATLTVVSLISGYLPARRVSRIDPLTALRSGA